VLLPRVGFTSLLVVAAGCAAPTSPPVRSPDVADKVDAKTVAEPTAVSEQATPEAEPDATTSDEDAYVPDEAVPLDGEVIGHVGLPCGTPTECPERAQFNEKVSLHATMTGRDRLAKDVRARGGVVPEVANPTQDGRAQIVCKADAYSAQVFVDRSDLTPVTTRFAVATPTREGAKAEHPDVGISLVPGARVGIKQTKGDAVKIGFEQYGLRGSGWLPKSAVGRFYRPATQDPRAPDDKHRRFVRWRDEVPLRAKPGGRAFATLRGGASVAEIGETRDKHRLVAVGLNIADQTYAVGWIPEQSLGGGGVVGGVLGSPGAVASGEPPQQVRVSAGSTLRSPQGAKVGVVRHDAEIECLADCETDTPMVQLRCVADFPARVDPQVESGSP